MDSSSDVGQAKHAQGTVDREVRGRAGGREGLVNEAGASKWRSLAARRRLHASRVGRRMVGWMAKDTPVIGDVVLACGRRLWNKIGGKE